MTPTIKFGSMLVSPTRFRNTSLNATRKLARTTGFWQHQDHDRRVWGKAPCEKGAYTDLLALQKRVHHAQILSSRKAMHLYDMHLYPLLTLLLPTHAPHANTPTSMSILRHFTRTKSTPLHRRRWWRLLRPARRWWRWRFLRLTATILRHGAPAWSPVVLIKSR